ncbi:hypothetical protein RB595_002390 [Gaeumannomyces hyphopodioides]
MAGLRRVAATSVVFGWAVAAACVPKDGFYGGGVTILTDNDLSNSPKKGSAALLLHKLAAQDDADKACKLLGESLWSPEAASFADGLNSSLSYQVYQGVFPRAQLFWVSRSAGGGCRAIDAAGVVSEVDCAGASARLPALCTQSAPVLDYQSNNNHTEFVVNQAAGGGLVYKGFRDFFVWKFRGVRFAATPTRFEHARPYVPTAADRAAPIPALHAAGECLQRVGQVPSESTEDCLFMNIWTPYLPPSPPAAGPDGDTPRPRLKPVMFYIYGGGFVEGSWKNFNTDGTMLASRGDVVVVSLNYRLGSLGWLAFADGVHRGNYGLSDLVQGLHWVRDNIRHFGGDPARVTIFGESAGAMLVRALLSSPKAVGLFRAAISQSAPSGRALIPGGSAAGYLSPAFAYGVFGEPLLAQLGCAGDADPVACMRRLEGRAIIEADPQAILMVEDGEYLVAPTLRLNGSAPFFTADVALMTGVNRDEAGVDFPRAPAGDLAAYFRTLQLPYLADIVDRVLASPVFGIPPNPGEEEKLDAVVRVVTDASYTCSEQAMLYSATRPGPSAAFRAVYAYRFNRTYNPAGYTTPQCGSDAPEFKDYYKCHAGEQMIVFGTWTRRGLPDRDGRDLVFTRTVVDQWAAFAHALDPNPDRAYLRARGYWSTLARVEAQEPWARADAPAAVAGDKEEDARRIRLLQYESRMDGYVGLDRCGVLGMPLTWFESR